MKFKEIIESSNTGLDAIKRAPIVDFPTDIRCLRIGDISQNRNFSAWGFTEVETNNYKKFQLKKGDIIVARTGATIGVNMYINCDLNAVYNNGLIRLRVKSNCNPKYAYYLLQSKQFKNYIKSISAGTSAQPNMQMNDLLNLDIPDFSIEQQNKIVEVLDSIDNKIKLNSEINNNLYEICRLKYNDLIKSSESWDEKAINELNVEVTDYVANGSFKSLADNVILYDEKEYALYVRNTDLKVNFTDKRKYVDKKSYDFLKKSRLKGGELIISNVGDVGSVFICPDMKMPMTLGSNVIMIYSTDDIYYNYYLYFYYTSHYGQYMINGITGGSAQPKFNKTDFRNMKIKFPSLDELKEFNSFIEPIYKKIELNIMNNEKLSQLRDTLLPKLMNGEIDLDNIEI